MSTTTVIVFALLWASALVSVVSITISLVEISRKKYILLQLSQISEENDRLEKKMHAERKVLIDNLKKDIQEGK